MQTRQLGRTGPTVSTLGLGAMGMSDMYGPSDRAESIATVHAALEAGVTLIDTGDFYGIGHNELLIGREFERDHDRHAGPEKPGVVGEIGLQAERACRLVDMIVDAGDLS